MQRRSTQTDRYVTAQSSLQDDISKVTHRYSEVIETEKSEDRRKTLVKQQSKEVFKAMMQADNQNERAPIGTLAKRRQSEQRF